MERGRLAGRDGRGHLELAVASGAILALCLSCILLAWASQALLPRAHLPSGYEVEACIARGYVSHGHVRVAVEWGASKFYTNAVCVIVPWVPALPSRGAFSLAS